jgi:TonB family protein
MKTLEAWMLAYLLNSLWQVPLLFAAAWAAARLARPAGLDAEHRIWVGALLLEVFLPACDFQPRGVWQSISAYVLGSWAHPAPAGHIRILLGPGATLGGAMRLSGVWIAVLVATYTAVVSYFAVRLLWGWGKAHGLERQSYSITLAAGAAESWRRLTRMLDRWGAEGEPTIAVSTSISGPVTVGVWRRILLVPPDFLQAISESDMEALFAHEFAHMQRHDFAKNLFYGLLSLPIAYHPAFWLTRTRLAESRELLCDAMAADAVAGRERYAKSLLRLASMLSNRTPARILHAIGIFDANNFERRVMNLTRKQRETRGVRRFVIVAACAVIALAACGSALALRMEVADPGTPKGAPTRVHVKADALKIVTKVPPVYPADAKASHDTLDGSVVLAVVIGKDGSPENIRVSKSLREDYDKSAIDAVRQWRWETYLLNGNPIEVDTTVTITYSIEE